MPMACPSFAGATAATVTDSLNFYVFISFRQTSSCITQPCAIPTSNEQKVSSTLQVRTLPLSLSQHLTYICSQYSHTYLRTTHMMRLPINFHLVFGGIIKIYFTHRNRLCVVVTYTLCSMDSVCLLFSASTYSLFFCAWRSAAIVNGANI